MAFDPEVTDYWWPVDYYFGGDHAVSHLLYFRFWNHFFADRGWIAEDKREPVKKLVYNGYINGPDGHKMSKSRGNVIDPLDVIDSGYGADALRMYMLFIGPYDQDAQWNTNGVPGTYRFLQRVWHLAQDVLAAKSGRRTVDNEKATLLRIRTQKATRKVTRDLDALRFNTAIAALMELVNDLNKMRDDIPFELAPQAWRTSLLELFQLLAPFAPHLSEELWHQFGKEETIHLAGWPTWDSDLLRDDVVTIVVQVNGKLRGELQLPIGSSQDDVTEAALALDNVQRHIAQHKLKKAVYVADKLINFVI